MLQVQGLTFSGFEPWFVLHYHLSLPSKGILTHSTLWENSPDQFRLFSCLLLPLWAMILHLPGPDFRPCLSFPHSTCPPLPEIKVNSSHSPLLLCSVGNNLTQIGRVPRQLILKRYFRKQEFWFVALSWAQGNHGSLSPMIGIKQPWEKSQKHKGNTVVPSY